MFRRMRSGLTYANVIATLALFLALGGGAYAVTQLPADSVGTEQLRNNAVISSKVKNGSLEAVDFKAGQIPPGPPGAPGADGVSGLEVVYQSTGSDSADSKDVEAQCPSGKRVTGGGGLVTGGTSAALTTSTVGSVSGANSWYVAGREIVPGPGNWALIAYAVCADAH
jgi:hypothetical protein